MGTNKAEHLPYVATINEYQVTIDGVEHGLGVVAAQTDTDDDGFDNLTEFHSHTSALDPSDKPASIELPPNEWRLLGVPLQAPVASATIADLFADDITGIYGQDWVIFRFDASLGRYIQPASTDVLEAGTGFWIMQSTDQTVQLDMPAGSTSVKTVKSPVCGAFSGCVERSMADPNTGSNWNLVANPFPAATPIGAIRVRSETGHCSGSNGCSIVEPALPATVSLVSPLFFGFDGNQYEGINESGSMQVWHAYWARVTSTDSLQTPTVLFRRN
jgi:hypothetical protein